MDTGWFGYAGTILILIALYPIIADSIKNKETRSINMVNLVIGIAGQICFLTHGIAQNDASVIVISSYFVTVVLLLYFLTLKSKEDEIDQTSTSATRLN